MKRSNLIWGILLILIGIILGLDANEVIDLRIILAKVFFDGWWTLFIIIPCFIGLLTEKDKIGNIIGIIIGLVLFLCYRNILTVEVISKLTVPTIFVIVGIYLIVKGTNKKTTNNTKKVEDENKENKEVVEVNQNIEIADKGEE